MIGKLLKYDMKATSRYLFPFYFLFIAITIINGLFRPFDFLESRVGFSFQATLSVIFVTLYILMIFGVLFGTIIVLVLRYYKNLLGDEGYLTFTLPVKTWQHVLSKLISSIVWIGFSIIVIILSILMIARIDLGNLAYNFSLFIDEINLIFGSGIKIIFPIYLIIALILMILTIFNSISIGHMFQSHKILLSFVSYFVFYVITQGALLITLAVYFFSAYGSLDKVPQNPETIPGAGLLIGIISLILAILAIGHYFSINYVMKNKLNLE